MPWTEWMLKELQHTQSRKPRLLVVDDQPVNIHLTYQIFSDDYDMSMATSAEQALMVCERQRPDLILLDVDMPGQSGLDLCRLLKGHPQFRDIPVIFVTIHGSVEEETACWDAGAVDFVNKPVNPITLRRRVQAQLVLKLQADRLRESAQVDPLTGLPNRRHFEAYCTNELRRSLRNQSPMAMAMIDVDHFKAYNDSYGHPAGDLCLSKVGQSLAHSLGRPTDCVARWGGEEFVAVMGGCDGPNAYRLAERMRLAVESLRLPHPHPGALVSVSIGLTWHLPDTQSRWETWLKEADDALYQAKHDGRNRVAMAAPVPVGTAAAPASQGGLRSASLPGAHP